MKNIFKIIALMAHLYLMQLILPDSIAQQAILGFILAAGAGYAAGKSGSKGPKPEFRDPAAEYEAAYKSQVEWAPKIYESDAEYRPKYTDLELSQQEQTLFGSEQQAGVLDMAARAQPLVDEMTRKSTTYQRAGDVADVSELGPQATEAFRRSAGTDEITRLLKDQAEERLTSDRILSPRVAREFDQVIGKGQAFLGKGYSAADLTEKAAYTGMQARQMEREDQQFAQSVAGTLQATSVDPFMAILGRPGQAMAAGESAWGKAAGIQGAAGPSGMFGMNPYFEGVGEYNANAANAANIAKYNRSTALTAGLIQGGASIAGAYGMGRMEQGESFFPWG
jgi:hypothetical protein